MRFIGASGCLVDEFKHGGDSLFDLIAAISINVQRASDRIRDIFLEYIQRFVKFTEQERFFRRLRIQQHHSIHVAVSHSANEVRLLNHLRHEHPAALLRNINAQFLHQLNIFFVAVVCY